MAKKVLHFTQPRIKGLPIPEKGRVEYYDDEVPKLICRVSASGKKSYSIMKWRGGKSQRVTLGSADEISVIEARKKALEALSAINSGMSPTADKRKTKLGSTKLIDVLEQYIHERDLKPYTVKNYRYKLELGFKDWLNTPISEINEDKILKRHKLLTKKGKTTANTTMRVLRLTLNYAKAVGMIETNPASILSKARLWHKNKRKDRVIPSVKLQEWHKAVDTLSNQKAKVYLFMLLYLGFRSNEALTLRWENIDFKRKLITLNDTKNRSDHTLPLPNFLLTKIMALKEQDDGNKWVFPSVTGSTPMSMPAKPIMTVIKACDVEFSPHDCRRTFATIAEAVNLPLTMIKRLMNHTTSNDVTGGYIVTEEETLREAINKIETYIQAKVTQQNNVITLARTKGSIR